MISEEGYIVEAIQMGYGNITFGIAEDEEGTVGVTIEALAEALPTGKPVPEGVESTPIIFISSTKPESFDSLIKALEYARDLLIEDNSNAE